MRNKKFTYRSLVLCLIAATALSACGGGSPQQPAGVSPVKSVSSDLVKACQAEGTLTLVAHPASWANYGEIFELFKATTGAKINSLNQDGSSADEIAAIEANKSKKGPEAPDVVDVGYAYGQQGVDGKYYQAYKVSTWDKIPDTLLGLPAKDPNGYWTGGYYGVMTLEVNTTIVKNAPQNWEDLLRPEYKGQVALRGDPRGSNQAAQSVFAAALANGGSLDNVQPGLDFFKKINEAGNFVPVIAKGDTVSKGSTPIVLAWDYIGFGDRDSFAGKPAIETVYLSPTIASMYVQAISAYAPHPNCAKVWMEIINSDEGQLARIKGYAHGNRLADMEARGVIPAELKAKLPAAWFTDTSAVSPSPQQLSAARDAIKTGWDTTVGVDVK